MRAALAVETPMNDRVSRFLARFLIPWYDPAEAKADRTAAAARERHTEEIVQQAVAARRSAEATRRAYEAMSRRLER